MKLKDILNSKHTLWICSGINEDTLSDLGEFATKVVKESESTGKYITSHIVLRTSGGDIDVALQMVRLLKEIDKCGQLNMIGMGDVASAGVTLFLEGTERFATPETKFLIHQARQWNMEGQQASGLAKAAKEVKSLNAKMLRGIRKHVKLTRDEVKKFNAGGDVVFNAKEAIANGLIGGTIR